MRPVQIETLERRELCSATGNSVRHISSEEYAPNGQSRHIAAVTQISYDKTNGLQITGTDADDRVAVQDQMVNGKRVLRINVTIIRKGANGTTQVRERFELDRSAVGGYLKGQRLRFVGKGGDDSFRFYNRPDSPQFSIFADGGAGRDELWGGPKNDVLIGGKGNDELHGLDGDDLLIGGSGNDKLRGDAGNDMLVGGTGQDNLGGGEDDDFLDGGYDNVSDVLAGNEGKDRYVGEWYDATPNAKTRSNRDTPILDSLDERPEEESTLPTSLEIAVQATFAKDPWVGVGRSFLLHDDHATDDIRQLDSYRNLWGPVDLSEK